MSFQPIQMGNDELILFIRKNFRACKITNADLGKAIWSWLAEQKVGNASIIEEDKSCYWGDQGKFVGEKMLPKTAAQFSFNRNILPELFSHLEKLGNEK